jgi:two-component system response regulator FixJ
MSRPLHNVFIVSGDDYVRQSLQRTLSVQGVSALVFEAAAGYLARPKPDAPACLILDTVLSDMSGYDLQKQLAGMGPPIIFATRQAEIACSVRAMRDGAFDFLKAPFDPQELVRTVHAALELDQRARPEREVVNGMRARLADLTPREHEVMRFVIGGMPNKHVAWELGISEFTVQIHRGHIMEKMGVPSFADLVRVALRLGIAPAGMVRAPRVVSQRARRTPTLKYRPTRSYGTPVRKLDSILV